MKHKKPETKCAEPSPTPVVWACYYFGKEKSRVKLVVARTYILARKQGAIWFQCSEPEVSVIECEPICVVVVLEHEGKTTTFEYPVEESIPKNNV